MRLPAFSLHKHKQKPPALFDTVLVAEITFAF